MIEFILNIRLLLYRLRRSVLHRLDPRIALRCATQKNRQTVLFSGIANIPDWQVHYASLEHFRNDIPALFPRSRHDHLVAQNFFHQDYLDDPGPKVFFSREPEEFLTDETRDNLAALGNSESILTFAEEDPDLRMYYVALPCDRRGIVRRLEKSLNKERPGLCCIMNRYKTDERLDLLQKRLVFIDAMQGDIDIFGHAPSTGPNPWDAYPNYRGAPDNKLQTLRSYTFNLCFENCDRDGYITEKLPQALLAGCVPLYWGGGSFLHSTIPQECYLDCRGQDPARVYQRIRTMQPDEILRFRRAGLEFLSSPEADKFCWSHWASLCIRGLLRQSSG